MRLLARDEPNTAAAPSGTRRLQLEILSCAVFGAIALTSIARPAHGFGANADSTSTREHGQRDIAQGPEVLAQAAARPYALLENRRVLSYPFEQVWPTAIRYLRIDRGYEVTDRDEEAGYILFEFPLEGGRTGSGSVEMFATEDAAGRRAVSVALNTGAGPVHLPNTLLDGLAAKLRAERGQPAPPPASPPKEEEPPPEQDEPEDDHSVPLLPPAIEP